MAVARRIGTGLFSMVVLASNVYAVRRCIFLKVRKAGAIVPQSAGAVSPFEASKNYWQEFQKYG
jgi:hypothetical protein